MNEHLLIIDDQESMRDIIAGLLRSKGFQISVAGSAKEGLKIFEKDPASFNLIISDVNMPEIDGFELLKMVKAKYPKTPVVLLTGINQDVAEIVGKEYHADGLIEKPFQVDVALKEIQRVLNG